MKQLIVLEELKKFLRHTVVADNRPDVREFALDIFLKIQKSEIEIPAPVDDTQLNLPIGKLHDHE